MQMKMRMFAAALFGFVALGATSANAAALTDAYASTTLRLIGISAPSQTAINRLTTLSSTASDSNGFAIGSAFYASDAGAATDFPPLDVDREMTNWAESLAEGYVADDVAYAEAFADGSLTVTNPRSTMVNPGAAPVTFTFRFEWEIDVTADSDTEVDFAEAQALVSLSAGTDTDPGQVSFLNDIFVWSYAGTGPWTYQDQAGFDFSITLNANDTLRITTRSDTYTNAVVVPEPGSMALLGLGVVAMIPVAARRRRRNTGA